ncbi:hypothetical protein C8Q70DRAFT_1105691 [Cubamyces menziesii]|nr:hypothetical protein C8Q70DRAFT_1105691 [Cubamyces menziesii]
MPILSQPDRNITRDFNPPRELVVREDVALPQLYDWNAEHNAQYPLFVFHDGECLSHITYSAANQAIDRAARLVLQELGPASAFGVKQPVIGLCADSETISYVCTSIGVMRAGYVAFFISTRNGPAAVADMLQRTCAQALLVSPDATTSHAAQEAIGMISGADFVTLEMPTFEYLFTTDGSPSDPATEENLRPLRRHFDVNLIAMIQHSSGTRLVNLGMELTASNGVRSPSDLWNYVEKYTADFPARPENLLDRPHPDRDVVLITGTTRGFGCDVLEHLLRDERVERVFAFNRKNSKAAVRQRKHFRARGLDEKLLDSPKFEMVEGVLDDDGFGICADLLDRIRRSVTHIMHNAWRVDFNMSLPSFDADLQNACNLIKLALASPFKTPPSLIFVSSIVVFGNYRGVCPAPEAPLDDPATVSGTSGYAEAKWITERMLHTAAQTTSLHTVVVRLGQVCGDRTGYWNEREWVPALVKSGHFHGCLPRVTGSVSWIPSYEAARAFAEMRHSRESVLHLVHPQRIPWNDMIAPIASQLNVPLVPYEDWLARLQENIDRDNSPTIELTEKSPALRLMSFFMMFVKASSKREPLGGAYLSTEKSTAASPTLAELPMLNERNVQRWMDGWKKSGFLRYAAPQLPRSRL